MKRWMIDEPWQYDDTVKITSTELLMDLYRCPFCGAINSVPDSVSHNPECIWPDLPSNIRELYEYAVYLEHVEPPASGTSKANAWAELKLALDNLPDS